MLSGLRAAGSTSPGRFVAHKPDPVDPRGYAVQQVWSAFDPKVSESAKTV
jgi:hypothetical protein